MGTVMPVFTIKAKDALAIRAVRYYKHLCEQAGLAHQATEVQRALDEMHVWRLNNRELIKEPDHVHVPAGVNG
jgi:hypothetical protein